MKGRKKRNRNFIFLVLLCLLEAQGLGQHLILAAPADPDDRLGFAVNPAFAAIQQAQALAGMQVFHLGFLSGDLALRNHFLTGSAVLPLGFGVGVTLTHLSTPLDSRTEASLAAAWANDWISVGGKLGILSRSFHEEEFDLVHDDDPLLSGGLTRTAFTLGAGLLLRPLYWIALAADVHHANRPDMSLAGEGAPESRLVDAGLCVSFSAFRISAGWSWVESRGAPHCILSTDALPLGDLSIGTDYGGLMASWSMPVGHSLFLHYTVHLPISGAGLEAAGSHQLAVAFEFPGRRSVEDSFVLSALADSLFVLEQRYTFRGLGDLPEAVLRRLVCGDTAIEISPEKISDLDPGLYSQTYRNFLDSLAVWSRTRRVILRSDSVSLGRAMAIAGRVAQKGGRPEILQVHDLEGVVWTDSSAQRISPDPAGTRFYLESRNGVRLQSWRLEIRDESGRPFTQFRGRGRIPREWDWDWRNKAGELAKPGWYAAVFLWQDSNNRWHETRPVLLQSVRRIQSSVFTVWDGRRPGKGEVLELHLKK